MLNLSVSVAVLMLEALLIKTWSQLGLNMSASLLLRRDQEGLPPEREGDGPTAAQENVLCFGEDVAIKCLCLFKLPPNERNWPRVAHFSVI